MILKNRKSSLRALQALALLMLASGTSSCGHLDGKPEAPAWWNNLPEQIFTGVHKSIWAVQDKCGNVRGTAFVVKSGSKKYLITAQHVLHGYKLDQLSFVRQEFGTNVAELLQEEIQEVQYVKRDDILDIAVLTGSNIEQFPALELSPDNDRHIRVFAVGMGLAKDYFGISITEGLIANPQKAIMSSEVFSHLRHIEHTANLLPGNSGGPLVDNRGRVVGVNVMALTNEGFRQFFASALRYMLNGISQTGIVLIKNTGMGRIKHIAITKFGAEPVLLDLLPERLGKVNGQSSIQFHLPEGRYIVTLDTEEQQPATREISIESAQTTVVEYAFATSGFRFFNTSCDLIHQLIIMSEDKARLYMESTNNPQLQQKLITDADVLDKNQLFPGQVWVEYFQPGQWHWGAYKIDPKRGLTTYDMQPPQTIEGEKIKDLYIH